MNLRVNDTVEVIAGSEKGKRGRVLKVLHKSAGVVNAGDPLVEIGKGHWVACHFAE